MQNFIARCSLGMGITLLAYTSAPAAPATQPANNVQAGEVVPPASDTGKLLVLPFHETAAANYGWVGKAIQQDLVADLTRATRAQVAAPSSATAAQDAQAALDAARQAGAGLVVYGQFQTVGGQMRITGQVLSVQTGQSAGSISATAASKLFPLEDTVSSQVLRALPATLLTAPLPPIAPAAGAAAPPVGVGPAPSPTIRASVESQSGPAAPASSSQYYSYTYPDYSSGPPSQYPGAYLDSPYYYGYPYYWYSVPYYGPDIFFFYGWDHFHHHFHDFGHSDRWHQGEFHNFGVAGRAGTLGANHAPIGRSSSGGGAFHGGGGGGRGGGGGFHGGGGGHR